MAHLFVILNNGVLETYSNFEDIPESYDNLIRFEPEIPEGPHTEEQHEEISSWEERFKQLMSRETK